MSPPDKDRPISPIAILQGSWKGYSVVVVDEDLRPWVSDQARARGISPADVLRQVANDAIRERMEARR